MNNIGRTVIFGLALLGALLWAPAPTLADGITTYTESSMASGSLGSTSFSNALVTINLLGNTSTVLTVSPGIFEDSGAATVTVQGIGTATFTDSLVVFDNDHVVQFCPCVGIFDSTLLLDVLDTRNSAFGTYGLTTNIGPITGSSLFNPGKSFATTDGKFVLSSSSTGNSTFTATTAAPEPSSLLLLGVGFAGLFCARRKKARNAAS